MKCYSRQRSVEVSRRDLMLISKPGGGGWQRGLEPSWDIWPSETEYWFSREKKNMANFRGQRLQSLVKRRFACFTFKHQRKSSICPTSKFWAFWLRRDKCYTVNLWAGAIIETRKAARSSKQEVVRSGFHATFKDVHQDNDSSNLVN